MPEITVENLINDIEFDLDVANSIQDYSLNPSRVFLVEIVSIYNSIVYCTKQFERDCTGGLMPAGCTHLYHITAASIGSIMGHFELWQKLTFAYVFEMSRHFSGFDCNACVGKLSKDSGLNIDIKNFLAYRGEPVAIGQMVADSLAGWHAPKKVNSHFNALFKFAFYSNKEVEALELLWQIRHTMVHTGGWLTLTDSQKLKHLNELGNTAVFLKSTFVTNSIRLLHHIVRDAIHRLNEQMINKLPKDVVESDSYINFINVSSPRKSWLKYYKHGQGGQA